MTQNSKKIEGGPFGGKSFLKKVSQFRKKSERVVPLVSPGMACYAEKQEEQELLVQFARPNGAIWCNNFL